MKNIVIGLSIGILLSGIVCYAKETILANPLVNITNTILFRGLYTTKVTTPEGIYRVFIYTDGDGSAISTIKIK